jgi:hypothetical protein
MFSSRQAQWQRFKHSIVHVVDRVKAGFQRGWLSILLLVAETPFDCFAHWRNTCFLCVHQACRQPKKTG